MLSIAENGCAPIELRISFPAAIERGVPTTKDVGGHCGIKIRCPGVCGGEISRAEWSTVKARIPLQYLLTRMLRILLKGNTVYGQIVSEFGFVK